MTAVPGSGRVVHSRAVGAVTAASCAVHLGLVAGNHHGLWLGAVMLAMTGICLPCAVHLWHGARQRALRQVMGCALAMAALHAGLLLGASGHSHGGAAASSPGTASGAIAAADAVGLLAIVVLEITTAFLAATLLARLRSVPRTVAVVAR